MDEALTYPLKKLIDRLTHRQPPTAESAELFEKLIAQRKRLAESVQQLKSTVAIAGAVIDKRQTTFDELASLLDRKER